MMSLPCAEAEVAETEPFDTRGDDVIEQAGVGGSLISLAEKEVGADVVSSRQACRAEALEELEGLLHIFGNEISVGLCWPLCCKIIIELAGVECRVEIGVLLPELYPESEAPVCAVYIPPPFDASFLGEAGAEILQRLLEAEAAKLLGTQSIYHLVETARAWVVEYVAELKTREPKLSDFFLEAVLNETHRSGRRTKSMRRADMRLLPGLRGEDLVGPGEVFELVKIKVIEVVAATSLGEAGARKLLDKHGWSVDAALADHHPVLARSPSNFVEKLDELVMRLHQSDTFECLACCDTLLVGEGGAMKCGHYQCLPCWRAFLACHVMDGHSTLTCPGFKCKVPVEEELIMMMLPSLLLTRFRGWVQRSFLRSGGYQGCPGTGCEYAFRSNTATPTVGATSSSRRGSKSAGKASGAEPPMWVWCLCGHSWCAECRRPAHFPLSCSLSLSYYQADAVKELRDGFQVLIQREEKVDEMQIATKNCPRCSYPWWKNGGCNHFTCTCGHEFCWVCMKNWREHPPGYFECAAGEGPEKAVKGETIYRTLITTHQLEVEASEDLGAMADHLRRFCRQEIRHSLARVRLLTVDGSPARVGALVQALGFTVATVHVLLRFAAENHRILSSSFVLLFAHSQVLAAPSAEFIRSPQEGRRQKFAAKLKALLESVQALAYFLDVFDQTLIPRHSAHRIPKTLGQMVLLCETVVRLAASLQMAERELATVVAMAVEHDKYPQPHPDIQQIVERVRRYRAALERGKQAFKDSGPVSKTGAASSIRLV